MANYTKVITDAGLAKLADIASGGGTLEWTKIRAGDGAIGAGDPTLLADVISFKQEFDAIDVRKDSNGLPYVFFTTSNEGLAVGYLRREVGIFGRAAGDVADTLILYLYAPTDPDADFIPPPEGGIAAIQTFRVQIAQATGLSTTVTVDHSTVCLSLDRWADHLAGGGGVDQHPLVTQAVNGMMRAADKLKLDTHVGTGGLTQHPAATTVLSGFMHPDDKTKLDGIAAGAEVNQHAFSIVRVGATNVVADSKQDTLELIAGANIALTPDAGADNVTIAAVNVAPLSHVGTGGLSQHPRATGVLSGFMHPDDKNKLDGIQAGAEVNRHAFSTVRVGGVDVVADAKQDSLELVAGSQMVLTPNANNDSVTVGLGLPYYTLLMIADNTVPLANVIGHAETRAYGMHVAPKGGICWNIDDAGAAIAVFSMRINNITAGALERELYIMSVDDRLSYQIDSGAVVQLVASKSWKVTATISVPSGIHLIRFYVTNFDAPTHKLIMADWLDASIVWATGGLYY